MKLMLTFLGLGVVLVGGVLAYTFGAFDKIIEGLKRRFKKPAPVMLKDELENLGLEAPLWLARWAYLASLHPVERSFSVVYRSLRWLGEKTSAAETPAEAAERLKLHLPKAAPDVQALLEQCERSLYSSSEADKAAAHTAAERIWQAAWRASIRERWMAVKAFFRGGRPKKTGEAGSEKLV